MNDSTALRKKTLRQEMLRQRSDLSPELIRQTSGITVPHILEFIRKQSGKRKQTAGHPLTIMSYMSHAGEFPTRELNQKILDSGWCLVLPYTSREFVIKACIVSSLDGLRISSMGIPEPDPSLCPQIRAAEADLILLPGVAFDRNGMRLGYGKGCYDRFLSESSAQLPLTAGLAWSFQIVDSVPSEAHDHACDYLITEQQIFPSHRKNASADR